MASTPEIKAGEIAMRSLLDRRGRRNHSAGDYAEHGVPAGHFLWTGVDLWRVLWLWLFPGPGNGTGAQAASLGTGHASDAPAESDDATHRCEPTAHRHRRRKRTDHSSCAKADVPVVVKHAKADDAEDASAEDATAAPPKYAEPGAGRSRVGGARQAVSKPHAG